MSHGKLRGALIGCGHVARFHLASWALQDDVELAALCDRDPARLEAARPQAPAARIYRDAAQLCAAEKDLDFLEICTQASSHRTLVELAATYGLHVLCQKPAAESRTDLVAMIHACDRAGVRLMIHENWRYRSWYRALARQIAQGRIGRPIRLRIAHRDFRALRPNGFQEQPYLAQTRMLILLDMGCHLIDTARYLMGEMKSVMAMTGRFGAANQGEDVATLLVRFASGAMGLLDFSWCSAPVGARLEWGLNETVVEGDQATLRVLTDGSLERLEPGGTIERIEVEPWLPGDIYLEGYLATHRHFVEGLRTGAPHETSGRDNLAVMEVVWAAYQSARDGRTIQLGGPGASPTEPPSLVESADSG